jgi:hypothetical protein
MERFGERGRIFAREFLLTLCGFGIGLLMARFIIGSFNNNHDQVEEGLQHRFLRRELFDHPHQ